MEQERAHTTCLACRLLKLSFIEDNFKGFIDDIGVFSCDVFSLTWSNPVGKSDSMKRFNSQGLLSVELRLLFVRHIHFTLVGVFLLFQLY